MQNDPTALMSNSGSEPVEHKRSASTGEFERFGGANSNHLASFIPSKDTKKKKANAGPSSQQHAYSSVEQQILQNKQAKEGLYEEDYVAPRFGKREEMYLGQKPVKVVYDDETSLNST